MFKIINKIKSNYIQLKKIFNITDKKIKIVFYSESKFYQKFSYDLIKFFIKIYPGQVYYVSSDLNDKIDDLDVKNLFIGNGLLRSFFFSLIKAEYLFLTLTDLGNHSIKKNKNIDKYVYFNHSGSSTFRGYTEGSFDNYDIILCNGQYQIDEIRFREKQKNISKKDLILTGHFYFDHISKKINHNFNPNEILIAPTWSYDYKNFISENFISIIEVLLKKNYKVTFRPHPEHFKRSKNILEIIQNKFKSHINYRLDDQPSNIESMQKAKCLVTDISDIALEYMIVLNRPVLYLNSNKIHNKNYSDFKNFDNIELKFKDEFGLTFNEEDIKKIDLLIEDSTKNFNSRISELNQMKDKYYFNFGKTIEKFEKIWRDQILNSNTN